MAYESTIRRFLARAITVACLPGSPDAPVNFPQITLLGFHIRLMTQLMPLFKFQHTTVNVM